ncbi:cysteine peptidase family C39 domain-containing protein [Argonema galeatum]|uniref:cysteine peptidase family C39 domain-containing protein n=1 Tax=Argonema galeatum TaxID=2942762 RepID=UPI00201244F8|nr:cysteine peptidase family C39 domain-containing protein [Argonema galeatum]MCL1468036.1 hypothetical protein [Argonema galeatum A003/A1]
MKYPCILQHTDEDCGAACLASITQYHGRKFSIRHIRDLIGTNQMGTTLLGIRRGAESLGFNARGVRADAEILDDLSEVPLPAILHWESRHYVVLYGRKGRRYIVADPTVGLRYLSKKELQEGWRNYVMLLLEPEPARFRQQPEDEISGLHTLFARLWQEKDSLVQASLINLALGVLALAAPILIQILTDDVLLRRDTELLTKIVLAVGVIQGLSSALKLVQHTLIFYVAEQLELGLFLDFVRAILHLPMIYYETHASGEVTSRMGDIKFLNGLLTQTALKLPSQFFIALVSVGCMWVYSDKMAILAISIAAFMMVAILVFLPSIRQKNRTMLKMEADNQGLLVETFNGALTLKTSQAAPQLWEEFQNRFGRLARVSFSRIQLGLFALIGSDLVVGLGRIALLWFGSTGSSVLSVLN